MLASVIKRAAQLGLENPRLGVGMNLFWMTAGTLPMISNIPGRYRAALSLQKAVGFLQIKTDRIQYGEKSIPINPAVCRDLLRNGILQLRVKKEASFDEWLIFLRTKKATANIQINMAIAPELVGLWNPRVPGKSPAFNNSGTFPILEQLPIFVSSLFNVRKDIVRLPNGVVTDWLMIDAPGAVEVVPVTQEGKIILIEQPRHAAPIGWEVPAGVLEKNVDPTKMAAIELEEEAGFHASDIKPLGGYYIFVGSCNQFMRVFLARGLTEVGQKLEEHESISRVKAFTEEEVWKMIDQGQIRDSHTITALALAFRHLQKSHI